MKVKVFFNSSYKPGEYSFEKSLLVMIDVLRASSTAAAALYNGAKEIVPAENSEQAMKIFGSLDRSIRFIGGEKSNEKPAGFDAGNSPLDYTPEKVQGKTVIFTTTNGSPLFTRSKEAKLRLIASFVNFDAVLEKIKSSLINFPDSFKEIVFLCAGDNGQFSYEDSLCAGGLIYHLSKTLDNLELSDSADAAKNLFHFHIDNLFEFLTSRDHSQDLLRSGHEEDLQVCLCFNSYPVVPVIEGLNIKKSGI
jgi:2-phosphosulfolactate phosphatase